MDIKKEFNFLEQVPYFSHLDDSNPDFVTYYFTPCDDEENAVAGEWLFYIDIPLFFTKLGITVINYHQIKAQWLEALAMQAEEKYKEIYRLHFLFDPV